MAGRESIGTLTLAAIQEQSAVPVIFAELRLDTGTEYLHSWLGNIVWGSNTWVGAGAMTAVDELQESLDGKPSPIRLGLQAIDSTIRDIVDVATIQQRELYCYLGALDLVSFALIEDPFELFGGVMKQLEYSMQNGEDVALLTGESDDAELDRSPNLRYTNAQLQSEFPGDTGMTRIHQALNSTTVWGGRNVRTGSGGSVDTGGGGSPQRDPRREQR